MCTICLLKLYTCVYTFSLAHTQTYTHAHTQSYTHAHMHMYVYLLTHADRQTDRQTDMHTHAQCSNGVMNKCVVIIIQMVNVEELVRMI